MSIADEPFYRVVGQEWEVLQAAFRKRLPLLLKGPTGTGKSRFVEFAAHRLGLSLVQVSCNEDTTASDLLGRYLLKGGDTVWQDGPVTRAVRAGSLLYLDELAEAREDVVVLLHALTDHRREVYLDRTNEVLKAPPSFQLVVSYNPGYQRGFKELKPSTRQRFVAIDFRFPSAEVEAEILERETGLSGKACRSLAELAKQIRSLTDLQVTETVSTRLLVHVAALIKDGMEPRLACEVGVVHPLSDDADVIFALKDLVALRF